MSEGRVERRLAAILAADVVGYSRLMGQDEAGTLSRLQSLRRDLIDPKVADHNGRIVKTTGDGILIEFPSVVAAVACAVAVQREMAGHNTSIPLDRRMEFRVGINLGDVMVEGDDIHGDGVNVAARLEGLAEPGGICISGVVFDQVQGRLDVAFEDIGEQSLKNIMRPVRLYKTRLNAPGTPPLPDKPSIAVLPFQNMSGDPEQEYFADGMVEEIITALSRIRWLFVIARNSSFTYKGQHVDIKQVGRELGVRYVLEGSVRRGGNRVRVTAQLIEAESTAHLWADRFDGSLEDIFDVQDQIASRVAGVIEPKLQLAENQRSRRKPTENLNAYDCFLRAMPLIWRMTAEANSEALQLCKKAIELDQNFASAYALAAQCYVFRRTMNWEPSLEEGAEIGSRLARSALELGSDDPNALWMAGQALAYLAGDHDQAMIALERSLVLNPNSASAHAYAGWVHVYRYEPTEALTSFDQALRLSPNDPMEWIIYAGIGRAYLDEQRYEEAIVAARRALNGNPHWGGTYRILANAYGRLGMVEAAGEAVQKLLEIDPAMTVDKALGLHATRDLRVLAAMREGLKKAGLPE